MNPKKPLSKKEQELILALFYRTELLEDELIINNSTPYISKKTGIEIQKINFFLDEHLKEKFNKNN